ncbi:MAG: class I SAM-dependent methyltransferase [bacterium]|nr:class I SAM-dependent methyltransferase [bacterium]
MTSYNDFAYIYDRLMHRDINYERIADYIENIFTRYGISPELVCDLACGTGNITIPLSRRGYDMTGIDLSEDMLNVARGKSEGLDILYLCQNMADIDLYGTMGAFLCMIDGINYMITPPSLLKLFTRLKTCFMDPDALLIFDISSRYKLRSVIGNNTFIHSENDVFYSWQNTYSEKNSLCDMLLNFFVKGRNGYERFEERHIQRAYSVRELTFLLKKAGFSMIDTYEAMTFDKPNPESERIVFVCR